MNYLVTLIDTSKKIVNTTRMTRMTRMFDVGFDVIVIQLIG